MSDAIKSVAVYRTFVQRRRLTTTPRDNQERLDKIEKELYQKALSEMSLMVDEAQVERLTRRNKIFRAFEAKDYRNPITRQSITQALMNAK